MGYGQRTSHNEEAEPRVCIRPLGRGAAKGWVLPGRSTLDLTRVSAQLSGRIAGGSDVRLTVGPDGLEVDDRQDRRGVYLPLLGPTELQVGDEILVGRTLIRLMPPAPASDDTVADAPATERNDAPVRARLLIQSMFSGPPTTVDMDDGDVLVGGREGDVVIVDDPEMSGLHARIVATPTGLCVIDLDSREGTFRRARHGELIPLGHPMVVDDALLTSERFDVPGLAAQSAA